MLIVAILQCVDAVIFFVLNCMAKTLSKNELDATPRNQDMLAIMGENTIGIFVCYKEGATVVNYLNLAQYLEILN